jgi:predicted NodU family carbamoyl transferase
LVILGVWDGVEAGAALVVDSRPVAEASQRAFQAQGQRQPGVPWDAVQDVLQQAGIRERDVDLLAVAGRFSPPLAIRKRPLLRTLARDAFSPLWDGMVFWQAMLRQSGLGALEGDKAAEWFDQRFRERGFRPQRTLSVDMHLALAEGAYRAQADDRALVVVLHPMGDGVSLTVHRGSAGQLDLMWAQKGFSALHVHLRRAQAAIRMGGEPPERFWDLAARGEPDAAVVRLLGSQLRPEGLRLSRRMYPLPVARSSEAYALLAAVPPEVAAASVFENLRSTVVALLRAHREQWGGRTVVLAGSVFDHPRLCGAIAEMNEFERVSVGPSPGAASLAMGAAMAEGEGSPNHRPLGLGRMADDLQILRALEVAGVRGDDDRVEERAARVLVEGRPVARFALRAGPSRHGLGRRSILVRADRPGVVAELKSALQLPQDWPAVALVAEGAAIGAAPGILERLGGARYGNVSVRVGETFADRNPAVVGHDGRTIVQVVQPYEDPGLHALLLRLHAEGVEALAALPLGGKDEMPAPFPADALRTFRLAEAVPALWIGRWWVTR